MSKNIGVDIPGPVHTRVEGPLKSDEVFDAELCNEMVKRTNKLNDESIDLALRVKQAREFIAWSANHMRTSWLDWYEESKKLNKDVTEFRMAFDRESKHVIASGKDVAEFFNSPEYLRAHAILQETLAMLNSFAKMKQDGTLDAFADFILKIKCA